MKNITISLDDEVYRRARARAAELGSSVSALVRGFLGELASTESEFDRLKRKELTLRANVPGGFKAGDRIPRNEVHHRQA